MSKALKVLILFLPWSIKRKLLMRFFGYQLHPTAKIGFAFIYPDQLIMDEYSSIGHLSVAVHLSKITLGRHSTIGRSNWITGYPKGQPPHFSHLPDRQPELIIGQHSAITKHHHIDCTAKVEIGNYVTIAGYYSQLLSHSIDIAENRQDAKPITIGNYAFVGTNCVLLGGSRLPDYSVLGAKSLLNKTYETPYYLYAGVPAKPTKELPEGSKYFSRTVGYVE